MVLIFSTEPAAECESAVRRSASLVDVIEGEYGTFRPTIRAMGTVRPARLPLTAQRRRFRDERLH